MKKAQVSMEFLFVIGIILFLATFVLYDMFNKRSQIEETKAFLLKKDLCLEVSSFISGVYTKGIGTEAYLKLTGDQLIYPLTIQPSTRNIFVGENNPAYCTMPISSVSNLNEVVDWFKFNFSSDNHTLRFGNINNFVIVSLVEGYSGPEDEGDEQ